VRQRNDTGDAWTFMGDPPVRVLPGEDHDHDVLLDGWTAIDEPEGAAEQPQPDPKPTADERQPKTTTKSRRAAAADTERGESR
jgi:hypothetical protein